MDLNKEFNFKKWLEDPRYIWAKQRLNREVNSYKLEIDRSVFKKTKEEKELLLTLKAQLPIFERSKGYKFTTYTAAA